MSHRYAAQIHDDISEDELRGEPVPIYVAAALLSEESGGGFGESVNTAQHIWPQFKSNSFQRQYENYKFELPLMSWEYAILAYVGAQLLLFGINAVIAVSREVIVDELVLVFAWTNLMSFVGFVVAFAFSKLPSISRNNRKKLHTFAFRCMAISFVTALTILLIPRNCIEEGDGVAGTLRSCTGDNPRYSLGRGVLAPFILYQITKGAYFDSVIMSFVFGVLQTFFIAKYYDKSFGGIGFLVSAPFVTAFILSSIEATRMSAYLGIIQVNQWRQMKKKTHESEKKKLRSLLWNVAHDMKTPMQSFVAGMHVMQENPQKIRQLLAPSPDFKLKRDVEGVLRESFSAVQEMSASYELLMMQLNRAMDVASLENDLENENPHRSAVPLQEILTDVISVITTLQCNKTKIRVGRIPSYLSSYLMTARSWLSDNLLCIVSNAVQYSPSNSTVHLQLAVHSFDEVLAFKAPNLTHAKKMTKEQKLLVFKVTDAGIAEVKHEQLFSKMAKSSRPTAGAGLGLYALSLRMKRLGGACGSYSRRDGTHGSVFFFAVPYEPVDSQGQPAPECYIGGDDKANPWEVTEFDLRSDASTLTTVSSIKHSNQTCVDVDTGEVLAPEGILVVDDSLSTLKLMARAFKNAGALVTTATDGKQALEEMKQKLYSIVLMDIQMPVMDGLESISLFREWEESAQSRRNTRQFIVASSAMDCRATALMVGADCYYDKPMNMKVLLELYHTEEQKLAKGLEQRKQSTSSKAIESLEVEELV